MALRVSVKFSQRFAKDIKKLLKRFPNIQQDIRPFIESLQNGELLGDQLRGTGYTVFKARVPNRDSNRGKSGGYRIVYFLWTASEIVLLTIYSKSDTEDISDREVINIIRSELD